MAVTPVEPLLIGVFVLCCSSKVVVMALIVWFAFCVSRIRLFQFCIYYKNKQTNLLKDKKPCDY